MVGETDLETVGGLSLTCRQGNLTAETSPNGKRPGRLISLRWRHTGLA